MKKTIEVCIHCGSIDVQGKSWIKINENEIADPVDGESDVIWCEYCQEHGDNTEYKENVIGYQIVREGKNGIEIHPDMDASFCVYSLEQARKMVGEYPTIANPKANKHWKIVPVVEGEIEDPTLMF